MAFNYRLLQEAHEEYIDAFIWYELKKKGLGKQFAAAVEKKIIQIIEHPTYYGNKQNTNYRETKIQNFPYMIVYEFIELEKLVYITAIYHSNRNPKRKYRKR